MEEMNARIGSLINLLIKHEGCRLKPYMDTADPPRITIGVGRNLTDNGISEGEALFLLFNDIMRATQDVKGLVLPDVWARLSPEQRMALIDMSFNLGLSRLSQFREMFRAVNDGAADDVATEMLDSKWASQVGERAVDLARLFATGKIII